MNNSYRIPLPKNFNLGLCLDCGQAFRWSILENNIWHGVAFGKYLSLEKCSDGTIILYNTTEEDFNNIWCDYFDFNRDYKIIVDSISTNEILKIALTKS